MSIIFKMISHHLYEAKATPPHSKEVWSTNTPMSLRPLIQELQKLGCHQQDIGDALYDINPNWLNDLSENK